MALMCKEANQVRRREGSLQTFFLSSDIFMRTVCDCICMTQSWKQRLSLYHHAHVKFLWHSGTNRLRAEHHPSNVRRGLEAVLLSYSLRITQHNTIVSCISLDVARFIAVTFMQRFYGCGDLGRQAALLDWDLPVHITARYKPKAQRTWRNRSELIFWSRFPSSVSIVPDRSILKPYMFHGTVLEAHQIYHLKFTFHSRKVCVRRSLSVENYFIWARDFSRYVSKKRWQTCFLNRIPAFPHSRCSSRLPSVFPAMDSA